MKKGLKYGLLALSGVLCVGFALAGAACAGNSSANVPDGKEEIGVVHFLERGELKEGLGDLGDACLVASTGEFFRKTERGWQYEALTGYDIENNVLTASFKDGTDGTYTLIAENEEIGEHEHEWGDSYVIYEAKCVVPGIGLKYCTVCGQAFPEILAVEPEKLEAHNIKRCTLCSRTASQDTEGKDILDNYIYDVDENNSVSDVFDKVEDGDIVVLQEDATLKPDEKLVVGDESEKKDVILDVAGRQLTSEMKDETVEDGNTNIVVKEDSSLTITDTHKETEEGPKGSFNLNFQVNSGNYQREPTGQYALKIEGGELNVTDVDFNIENKTGCFAMCVSDGGVVNFDETTNLNLTGKDAELDKVDADNGNFGYGMFVTEGSTVNLNGTQLTATGSISPFFVGFGDQESTINVQNGSVIDLDGCFNWNQGDGKHVSTNAGFVLYTNGKVTFDASSEINIKGSVKDFFGTASYSVGFFCIGGGEVDFNGKMSLDMTSGNAFGFQVATNFYSGADGKGGIILNATVTIGANATINAVTKAGYPVVFAAQRNGVQPYIYDDQGTPIAMDTIQVAEGDAQYSVIIIDGATITMNGVPEYDLNYGHMSLNQGMSYETRLDYYTPAAIKDNRTKTLTD